jgi:hypothetical protein
MMNAPVDAYAEPGSADAANKNAAKPRVGRHLFMMHTIAVAGHNDVYGYG